MKENKGITLIALVVTVIVLIILAAISINLLLGTNGIITRSQEATMNYQKAEQDEQEGLLGLEANMEDILNPGALVKFSKNGDTTLASEHSTSVQVNLPNLDESTLRYIWMETEELEELLEEEKEDFIDFCQEDGTPFTNGETIVTPEDETGDYYLWIVAKDNDGEGIIARSNTFTIYNGIGYVMVWDWGWYAPNIDFTRMTGMTYTLDVYEYETGTLFNTYDVTDPEWNDGMTLIEPRKEYTYTLTDSLGNSQDAMVAN